MKTLAKTVIGLLLAASLQVSTQAGATLLHYFDGGGEPTLHKQGGGFLRFDGRRSVALGKAPVTGPWTFCAWVKRAGRGNLGALATDARYGIKLEQTNAGRRDGNVGVTVFGAKDYAFNYAAPVGTWVFLAFVYDGQGKTSLYVDAVLKDELTGVRLGLPRGLIGVRNAGGSSVDILKADLDDISFWNGALTPDLIQDLWLATPSLER